MFGTQAECKKDPKLLERKREKGICISRSKKAKLSLRLVFMEKLRKYIQGHRERESKDKGSKAQFSKSAKVIIAVNNN